MFAVIACAAVIPAAQSSSLHVLSYHDVQLKSGSIADDLGITVDQLAAHFAWLRKEGYTVVKIDDVLAAQRGERPLPERAVLLSFDDGLASVYTNVLPLLEVFQYSAVIAVVGRWVEDDAVWPIRYGRKQFGRDQFLSDTQLRTLARSPLIEFASHSYDLHRGLLANDSGQEQPAAVVRIWDSRLRVREEEAGYADRIRADLARSRDVIAKFSGVAPRVIVWPFGEFTGTAAQIARDLGMTVGMTLTEGVNTIPGRLTSLKRHLVSTRTDLARLSSLFAAPEPVPVRFMTARIDEMVGVTAAQREKMLDRLIDRVSALGATHVLIPAWTDSESARAVFATQASASEDVFNRVAWQLRTRLGVKALVRWPTQPPKNLVINDADYRRAFDALIDTVPLAGVVFDFDGAVAAKSVVTQWSQRLRDSHPDDLAIWAIDQTAPQVYAALRDSLPPDLRPDGVIAPAVDLNGAVLRDRWSAIAPRAQIWFEFSLEDRSNTSEVLAQKMRLLQRQSWLNFGWKTDDTLGAMPDVATVRRAFSRRAELR